LKARSKVTQDYLKWHYTTDRIQVPIWRSAVYGPILYRFTDEARHQSKVVISYTPPAFDAPVKVTSSEFRHNIFRKEKLEWWGYQKVNSLRMCLAVSIQYTNVSDIQTVGQTARHGIGQSS